MENQSDKALRQDNLRLVNDLEAEGARLDQLRASLNESKRREADLRDQHTNELTALLATGMQQVSRIEKERDQLAVRVKTLEDALKLRQRLGHNDTCSAMLSTEYECDCGYNSAKQALATKEPKA